MRTISLTTANREFSRLIRDVERGEAVRPIARLEPYWADRTAESEWAAAYARMMAQLEEGASLSGLKIRRKELYRR